MNVSDLLIAEGAASSLRDVLLEEPDRQRIAGLLREHRYIGELRRFGLPVSNKVLLAGASGCGKTMTANAVAGGLGRRILTLNLSTIVSARIGETAQQLKLVFDKAAREQAVLFLDEFDHIGKARGGAESDVGEMRRLVNTLIQLVDLLPEHALLICATNHAALLDPALLRRFQLRIEYRLPGPAMLDAYYDRLGAAFPERFRDVLRVYDISYAEARDLLHTHVKDRLIRELEAQPAAGIPAGAPAGDA